MTLCTVPQMHDGTQAPMYNVPDLWIPEHLGDGMAPPLPGRGKHSVSPDSPAFSTASTVIAQEHSPAQETGPLDTFRVVSMGSDWDDGELNSTPSVGYTPRSLHSRTYMDDLGNTTTTTLPYDSRFGPRGRRLSFHDDVEFNVQSGSDLSSVHESSASPPSAGIVLDDETLVRLWRAGREYEYPTPARDPATPSLFMAALADVQEGDNCVEETRGGQLPEAIHERVAPSSTTSGAFWKPVLPEENEPMVSARSQGVAVEPLIFHGVDFRTWLCEGPAQTIIDPVLADSALTVDIPGGEGQPWGLISFGRPRFEQGEESPRFDEEEQETRYMEKAPRFLF